MIFGGGGGAGAGTGLKDIILRREGIDDPITVIPSRAIIPPIAMSRMANGLLLVSIIAVVNAQDPLFPGSVQGQFSAAPLCPNGVMPKLDTTGQIIQCLPGAGQYTTCGPIHTCFFSGLNYMCCPTNEPPLGAQPVCPNNLNTVLDEEGIPTRCIPGRKACPYGNNLCLHAGREHICCEYSPSKAETRKAKLFECPRNTLGVLNSDGSPVSCTDTNKCPGKHQLCLGNKKRSICCERIAARTVVDDETEPKEKLIINKDTDSVEDIRPRPTTPMSGLKRKVRPEKEDEKIDKRQQFLNEVQHIHLAEVPAKETKETVKPLKKKKLSRTTTPTTTTTDDSDKEKQYEESQEGEGFESTTAFTFPDLSELEQIEITSAPITKTEGETTLLEVPPAPEIRHREPEFARPRALSSKTFSGAKVISTSEKRIMAQNFLMAQIKRGWPYHDRFYRPDVPDDDFEEEFS